MKRFKCSWILWFALMVLPQVLAQAEESEGSFGGGEAALKRARAEMAEKHQMLIDQAVDMAAESAVFIPLDSDTAYQLNVEPKPDQIGITRRLALDVNLMPILGYRGKRPFDLGFGAAARRDKDIVWTGQVISESATAVRLHFEDFDLPAGVEVYVFNDAGQAYGPYTGRGTYDQGSFWSDTLFGELAWVQVHIPAETRESVAFAISDIAHFGPQFFIGQAMRQYRQNKSCGSGGVNSCIENAMCYNNSIIDKATDAVAHYLYKSDEDSGWYMCSGGLINDTDDTTNYPYFITARHCISSNSEAQTLNAYFDFITPGCMNLESLCNFSLHLAKGVSGASLMATGDSDSDGDYALLKLDGFPSGGHWRLGWTSSNWSDNDGDTVYRVSHPNGYPQAYSTSTISTSLNTCGNDNYERPKFIWSYPDIGGIMGGSSGAPLLNSSSKIIGTLTGGCEADNACTATTRVVDGAFRHAYWKNLRPFINPTAMHVDYIDVVEEDLGGIYRPKVTIRVVDSKNVPVSGAFVMAIMEGPINFPMHWVTDRDGVATISGPGWHQSGVWTACVRDIVRPGLTMSWDRSADKETCDSN